LAERHGSSVQQHLHETGAVGDAFAEAGLQDVQTAPYEASLVLRDPDVAVTFLIQGLSFFQRELEILPWQARQELIATLKREGAKLCAETTPEQRTLATPFRVRQRHRAADVGDTACSRQGRQAQHVRHVRRIEIVGSTQRYHRQPLDDNPQPPQRPGRRDRRLLPRRLAIQLQ